MQRSGHTSIDINDDLFGSVQFNTMDCGTTRISWTSFGVEIRDPMKPPENKLSDIYKIGDFVRL